MPRQKKPSREELRVRSVGIVLTREVSTGHMDPRLARELLARMDQAYALLLQEYYPKETKPNG